MPLSSGKKSTVGVRSPLGPSRGEGPEYALDPISSASIPSGIPRPVTHRSNSSPMKKPREPSSDVVNSSRRSLEVMPASRIPRASIAFFTEEKVGVGGRPGCKGRPDMKKVSWDKSMEGPEPASKSKDIFSFADNSASAERPMRSRKSSNASASSVAISTNGGKVPRKRSITSATSPRAAGFTVSVGRLRGKSAANGSLDLAMTAGNYSTPLRDRSAFVDGEDREILRSPKIEALRTENQDYSMSSFGDGMIKSVAPTPTNSRSSSEPSSSAKGNGKLVKVGSTSAEGSPAPVITRKRPLPSSSTGPSSFQSSVRVRRHVRSRSNTLISSPQQIKLSPSPSVGNSSTSSHKRANTRNSHSGGTESAFQQPTAKQVSRPSIFRRITTPMERTTSQDLDMTFPVIPKRMSDERSPSTQPLKDIRPAEIHTPAPIFGDEKPSPLAFMSTGLIKKGSGSTLSTHSLPGGISGVSSAPNSCIAQTGGSSLSMASMFMRNRAADLLAAGGQNSPAAPDTPIKHNVNAMLGGFELPPLHSDSTADLSPRGKMSFAPMSPMSVSPTDPMDGSFRRAQPMTEPTTIGSPKQDKMENMEIMESRRPSMQIQTRGLRRKGSTMWARTNSGSTGCGSWYGVPDGFDIEPTTPTRHDEIRVSKLDFSVVTPSPTTQVRSYPFATGHRIDPQATCIAESPSPPQKRASLLSRFQTSNRQRPIARASNPLLNAAYKLGEQQASRKTNTAAGLLVSSLDEAQGVGKFERDFVMIEPIGKGEFSTVWKVREKRTGAVWAVKRGKPYSSAKDRLRQMEEISILKSLSEAPNPHVLDFQEAWEQNQQLHIRTGLADYGDLATYLSAIGDEGGLGEARCWKVLAELTSGLRHIHSLNILHLDLKPANILITSTGSLRIGDFGLSTRHLDQSVHYQPSAGILAEGDSLASLREGDREYLSPEVLRGVFGKPADMFSLGISMMEMAMNVVLPSNGEAWQRFRADDFSDLKEHYRLLDSEDPAEVVLATSLSDASVSSASTFASQQEATPALSLVSHRLLAVITGLMASDPETRWTSQDLAEHSIIQRIAHMRPRGDRGSVEIHTRTSTDEWEGWRKDHGFDLRSSPKDAEVEWLANGTSREVKPALIVEDEAFLSDMMNGRW